ncbi:MAG TPA: ribosomal protein S18-alanine N-acetyltransferase [Candidatus Acidoferrales bacterium]|nr:ribosomal protein S18-alanine N-acetyltransferase [Candidatus Acidoferrales bacterium]
MASAEGKPLGQESSALRPADLELRRIEPADLDEVMRIEKSSFPTPWSTRFFVEELRAPCAQSFVACRNGRIVGYILYWVLPGALDIHNVAVDRDYRRQGVGRSLLNAAIAEAKERGLQRVTLEVRRSNQIAQSLYYKLGFVVQGVRAGYYSDNGEDAFVMALDLGQATV